MQKLIIFILLFISISVYATDTIQVYQNCTIKRITKSSAPSAAKAVDLGLSVKWANMNIGATAPEGYGDYYAWGEIATKSSYSWENYKYSNGTATTLTKYCSRSLFGKVDNKTSLEPSDDVVRVKWQGQWRMPTKEEITELVENCNWTSTTQNNVKGWIITSKKNGNTIFIPAAGDKNGDELRGTKDYAFFWASTRGTTSYHAYRLRMIYTYDLRLQSVSSAERSVGHSIRAVYASTFDYTLTFKANGCDNQSKFSYDKGDKVVIKAIPTTGYKFVKWSDENTSATRTITVSANATYTATFEAKTFTVNFNANGGTTSTTSKTVTYASTYGTLPTPTRTGYTFDGWYTATSGGTKITSSSMVSITANQTLYAHWTIKALTISTAAENGTVSGAGIYNYNTTAILTATPNDCYNFVKWSDGNTSNPRNVTVTASATYTAIFEKIIYNVSTQPDNTLHGEVSVENIETN